MNPHAHDGRLEVVRGGAGCTVQDAGRVGHRHEGVALSGWLDGWMAGAANALAGNLPQAACLEWRGPALRLRVAQGPVRVAVAGGAAAWAPDAQARPQPLPPWQSVLLEEGAMLDLAALSGGCAWMAVSGGVRVAPVLGSRSTHLRTRMGGLDGRMLQPGDAFGCSALAPQDRRLWCAAAAPDWLEAGPIRVLPGPQQDHFSAEAWARLLDSAWQVTPALDRMGLRLAGPALAHVDAAAADIVSDGVVPGAIQVPADGQPIVLLADAQTVGGYPKIATVIRADLPRLAHVEAGDVLRFCCVDAAEAAAARRAQASGLADWLAALQPAGTLDTASLLSANLAGAAVRGDEP